MNLRKKRKPAQPAWVKQQPCFKLFINENEICPTTDAPIAHERSSMFKCYQPIIYERRIRNKLPTQSCRRHFTAATQALTYFFTFCFADAIGEILHPEKNRLRKTCLIMLVKSVDKTLSLQYFVCS